MVRLQTVNVKTGLHTTNNPPTIYTQEKPTKAKNSEVGLTMLHIYAISMGITASEQLMGHAFHLNFLVR